MTTSLIIIGIGILACILLVLFQCCRYLRRIDRDNNRVARELLKPDYPLDPPEDEYHDPEEF